MTVDKREIVESPITQGQTESVAYTLDTTPQGGNASSPSVQVLLNGRDVTAVNATGSASVAADVITTPAIHSLIPGNRYTLLVQWSADPGLLSAYAYIDAGI